MAFFMLSDVGSTLLIKKMKWKSCRTSSLEVRSFACFDSVAYLAEVLSSSRPSLRRHACLRVTASCCGLLASLYLGRNAR